MQRRVAALVESGLQEREPAGTAAPLDRAIAAAPVPASFALHAALTSCPWPHAGPLSAAAVDRATLLTAGVGPETAENVAICMTQAPEVYNVAVAL